MASEGQCRRILATPKGKRWNGGFVAPRRRRVRMILACAEGRSNIAVAADLEVSDETVGKWRSRFLERRLDGLSDEAAADRERLL